MTFLFSGVVGRLTPPGSCRPYPPPGAVPTPEPLRRNRYAGTVTPGQLRRDSSEQSRGSSEGVTKAHARRRCFVRVCPIDTKQNALELLQTPLKKSFEIFQKNLKTLLTYYNIYAIMINVIEKGEPLTPTTEQRNAHTTNPRRAAAPLL